jgi:hypothetical protein
MLLTVLSLGLFLALAVAGILVVKKALDLAKDPDSAGRSGVFAGLGSGLLTSSAVSLAVVVLQLALDNAGREAAWRGNFETAYRVAGFRASDHPLDSLVFSGKELDSPDMRGANLRGKAFRGAQLPGARLDHANLAGADLLGADLSTAELTGAILDGAKLQGTRFDTARIEHAASLKDAVVNSRTCWPAAFLESKETRHLVRQLHPEVRTGEAPRGREYPRCR